MKCVCVIPVLYNDHDPFHHLQSTAQLRNAWRYVNALSTTCLKGHEVSLLLGFDNALHPGTSVTSSTSLQKPKNPFRHVNKLIIFLKTMFYATIAWNDKS